MILGRLITRRHHQVARCGVPVKFESDDALSSPLDSAIERTMAQLARAEAWTLELSGRKGEPIATLTRRGDVDGAFPGFRDTVARFQTTLGVEPRSIAWMTRPAEAGDGETRSAAPGDLLLFVQDLPTGDVLRGGVTLAPDRFTNTAFGSEDEFLDFLSGLATGVARIRRLRDERWAMRRLLSLLAVQCVLIHRSGRVAFETLYARHASASTNAALGVDIGPIRGLVKKILSKQLRTDHIEMHAVQIFTIKCNSHAPNFIYVIPLSEESADKPPEFFAFLLPKPGAPPRAEVLAATLALTPTESRVVRLLLEGKKASIIAHEMNLTEQTVRTYIKRIYAKNCVSSQSELVAAAHKKLVPIEMNIDTPVITCHVA